ncbi:hypothetical protein GCM10009563_23940 [Subtercola frigoramans]
MDAVGRVGLVLAGLVLSGLLLAGLLRSGPVFAGRVLCDTRCGADASETKVADQRADDGSMETVRCARRNDRL